MSHSRKYGKNAAQIPTQLKWIEHYFAGDLPKPPAKVAVPAGVDWQMDGNDQYGDCGPAGLKHGFQNAMTVTGESESMPTGQQVVDYYLKYTDGQDSGVVLSSFLKYVEQNKFYGHTIQAYAPVAVHNIPTLQFAVSAYKFAYTGIVVTPEMQEAFGNGQPWTLDVVLGQPEGGHCIPIVGYDSAYLYAVTWGRVQPIAYSAWHHISDEAWAVMSGELASATGVDLASLQKDLKLLNR